MPKRRCSGSRRSNVRRKRKLLLKSKLLKLQKKLQRKQPPMLELPFHTTRSLCAGSINPVHTLSIITEGRLCTPTTWTETTVSETSTIPHVFPSPNRRLARSASGRR